MNLDELVERVKGHTPQEWARRGSGQKIYVGKGIISGVPGPGLQEEIVPHHVVHVFKDEHGRRHTQFVAMCDGANLPNDANAELIAAAPSLLTLALELQAEAKKWSAVAFNLKAELTTLRASLEQAQKRVEIGGDVFEANRNQHILHLATELEYLTRAEKAEASLEQAHSELRHKKVVRDEVVERQLQELRSEVLTLRMEIEYANSALGGNSAEHLCDRIKALRAELEQVRGAWVSVEERLPEMDGITYMMYRIEHKTGIRFVDIMTAQNQAAWYNFGQRKLPSGITHWRPLPAPPSPSKEGR